MRQRSSTGTKSRLGRTRGSTPLGPVKPSGGPGRASRFWHGANSFASFGVVRHRSPHPTPANAANENEWVTPAKNDRLWRNGGAFLECFSHSPAILLKNCANFTDPNDSCE